MSLSMHLFGDVEGADTYPVVPGEPDANKVITGVADADVVAAEV
jgi:hypothetical protein